MSKCFGVRYPNYLDELQVSLRKEASFLKKFFLRRAERNVFRLPRYLTYGRLLALSFS
jgi:hypothetical protein